MEHDVKSRNVRFFPLFFLVCRASGSALMDQRRRGGNVEKESESLGHETATKVALKFFFSLLMFVVIVTGD